jgi:hypothetical protein
MILHKQADREDTLTMNQDMRKWGLGKKGFPTFDRLIMAHCTARQLAGYKFLLSSGDQKALQTYRDQLLLIEAREATREVKQFTREFNERLKENRRLFRKE